MRFFSRIFTVLILLPSLLSCSDSQSRRPARANIAPVKVTKVAEQDIPLTIQLVGNVEPFAQVALKTQVGGIIVKQYVQEGQKLKAGDILFELDKRPYQAEVSEAEAKLKKNQVLLRKAEEDERRYSGLRQQKVISLDQYEQSQTNTDSIKASIDLDKAVLQTAKLNLEYATIRSPIDGRAGTIVVNEGNVIKANDERSLLTITQIQPVDVTFALPEARLAEVMSKMAAGKVEVSALPPGGGKTPAKGDLVSMDNVVDRATGTIKVRARFPNEDERLWPGLFVRLNVHLGVLKNALTIPAEAALVGINGSYVYVVKDGNVAEARDIKSRLPQDGLVVVNSGLKAGETVIYEGQVRVAPGTVVEIREEGFPKR